MSHLACKLTLEQLATITHMVARGVEVIKITVDPEHGSATLQGMDGNYSLDTMIYPSGVRY